MKIQDSRPIPVIQTRGHSVGSMNSSYPEAGTQTSLIEFFRCSEEMFLEGPTRTKARHVSPSSSGLLCILLGLAMAVAHRMQPHRLKAFFNQSAEDSVLEWSSEEGGLLSPRYRSMAEIPETQDIPMSETSSETCFKEEHIKQSDCAL